MEFLRLKRRAVTFKRLRNPVLGDKWRSQCVLCVCVCMTSQANAFAMGEWKQSMIRHIPWGQWLHETDKDDIKWAQALTVLYAGNLNKHTTLSNQIHSNTAVKQTGRTKFIYRPQETLGEFYYKSGSTRTPALADYRQVITHPLFYWRGTAVCVCVCGWRKHL